MPNPYANKIIYGGQVLIDLTSDTATATDVKQGKIFHDKSGATLVGEASLADECDMYASKTEPSAAVTGDLWVDTSDESGNIAYGEFVPSSTTQSTATISHNLGVIPDTIIVVGKPKTENFLNYNNYFSVLVWNKNGYGHATVCVREILVNTLEFRSFDTTASPSENFVPIQNVTSSAFTVNGANCPGSASSTAKINATFNKNLFDSYYWIAIKN